MSEKEGGVFLVRDSISIQGDFVLCVREDSKVSHYIINKIQQSDKICYRIGDQIFPDIPSLLAFYKLHYLDSTPLIRPAPRKIQRVIARYDFEGNDPDDLPFRKGKRNLIFCKMKNISNFHLFKIKLAFPFKDTSCKILLISVMKL